MKTKYFFTALGLVFFTYIKSQVGIGTVTPSDAAVLELSSTDKGLLIDTVTLTSAILPAPFTSNIEGMFVYNTATAGTSPNNVVPGLYYNNGLKWILMSITGEPQIVGDIKASMETADHDGWFLLNGRNITTLTAIPLANAQSLGYTTVIPNATDRILKGINTATENTTSVGGTNSFLITRANFPNFTMTGTTASAGAHSHQYNNRGATYWHYEAGNRAASRFVDTETRTTGGGGAHLHNISIPSGGTQTAIAAYPKHVVVQYFIYLGK